MKDEIIIQGTQNFMGFDIPVIAGGFGKGKKCILAKDIAEIHGLKLFKVNELLNNNINEFQIGVDILDLKTYPLQGYVLENGLFTNAQWGNAKNIYLLSEQGYMLLVGFMKTEKAKEIRKQLRREYFTMRELVNSDEQLKAQLLLKLYNGGIESIEASKQLAEIESNKARKETVEALKSTIDMAEKFMQTTDTYDIGTFAKVLGVKGMGRNNLFKFLKEQNVLMPTKNIPYSRYEKYFEVKYTTKEDPFGNIRTYPQSRVNVKGMSYILKKLNKSGFIATKSVEDILVELHSEDLQVA